MPVCRLKVDELQVHTATAHHSFYLVIEILQGSFPGRGACEAPVIDPFRNVAILVMETSWVGLSHYDDLRLIARL